MNNDQFIYFIAFKWAREKQIEELYQLERSKDKLEKNIAFRAIQIKQNNWQPKEWQKGKENV